MSEINFYSDFGARFAKSASNVGISAQHDSFETGMVEIRNEDWRTFMEDLGQLA